MNNLNKDLKCLQDSFDAKEITDVRKRIVLNKFADIVYINLTNLENKDSYVKYLNHSYEQNYYRDEHFNFNKFLRVEKEKVVKKSKLKEYHTNNKKMSESDYKTKLLDNLNSYNFELKEYEPSYKELPNTITGVANLGEEYLKMTIKEVFELRQQLKEKVKEEPLLKFNFEQSDLALRKHILNNYYKEFKELTNSYIPFKLFKTFFPASYFREFLDNTFEANYIRPLSYDIEKMKEQFVNITYYIYRNL